MKQSLFVISFLFFSMSFSQEKNIKIDYTVDYLIPRKSSNDTLSVGFEKNGKYIWTNSKQLAIELGKSIFKNNPDLLDNSELGIVFDTENSVLMMLFKSGNNEFFFNFELGSIIPKKVNYNNSDEDFELVSVNTNQTINLLNKVANVYDIHSATDNSDPITVAFDESVAIENSLLFKSIFELVIASEGGNFIGLDIPNGLILKVENKGKTLLEAYKISEKTKNLNINYSFKITE